MDELEENGIDTACGHCEHQMSGEWDWYMENVPVEDVVTRQRIAEHYARLSVLTSLYTGLDADLILQEVSAEIPVLKHGMEGPFELVQRPPAVDDDMSEEELIELAGPLIKLSKKLELDGVHPQRLAGIHMKIAANMLFRHIGNARTVSLMFGMFGKLVDVFLKNPEPWQKHS